MTNLYGKPERTIPMMSHFKRFGKCELLLAALLLASSLDAFAGAGAAAGGGGAAAGGARAGGAAAGGARGGTAAAGYASPGTIGTANIMVDPETRQVVVVGSRDVINSIQDVVNQLDAPKPQVLIKCVFIDVTYNRNLDVGVDATYANTRLGDDFNPLAGFFTNSLITQGVNAAAPGGLYQVLAQDYKVTLRAAAQNGNLKVLSRPSILARNNQLAIIQVGADVPTPTGTTVTATGVVQTQVQNQSVGIILRVTPFINRDGQIEMLVAPEVSSIDPSSAIQLGGGATAPIIRRTYAETVVVTRDGVPVVIGGLMQTDKADVVDKVPLLGDIPILGWLFKKKTKTRVRAELLIFVTTRILPD